MVSLAALWKSVGVRPAAVVGHPRARSPRPTWPVPSASPTPAGWWPLRSQALAQLAPPGGMASVLLGAEETQRLLNSVDGVSVAAINSATSTVVAGGHRGPHRSAGTVRTAGHRRAAHRGRLRVAHRGDAAARGAPAHRPGRDLPRSGDIALHSTLTGTVIDTADMDAMYWCDNLTDTVRGSSRCCGAGGADGYRTFIEASPAPRVDLRGPGGPGRGRGDRHRARYPAPGQRRCGPVPGVGRGPPGLRGVVDLATPQPAGRQIDLPTFAFDRTRFPAVTAPSAGTGDSGGAFTAAPDRAALRPDRRHRVRRPGAAPVAGRPRGPGDRAGAGDRVPLPARRGRRADRPPRRGRPHPRRAAAAARNRGRRICGSSSNPRTPPDAGP